MRLPIRVPWQPAELVFSAAFFDRVRDAPEPERAAFARYAGQLVLDAKDGHPVFVCNPDAEVEYERPEDPAKAPYRQVKLGYDARSFRSSPTSPLRLRLPPAPAGARFLELGALLKVADADEGADAVNDRLDLPLGPLGVVGIEAEFWRGRMPYVEDARMFRVGLSCIFGDAIPPKAIEALRLDFVEDRFEGPTWQAARDLEPDVKGFFHQGTIFIDEALILEAKDDPIQRWKLFLVMIEEFGHFLDDRLRKHYSQVGGDATGDEGTMFAADFVHYNKIVDSDFGYATFDIDEGMGRHAHAYALDPAQPSLETKAEELLFVEDALADQGDVTLPSGEKVRVEFFKIRGGGAVHEDITKWAAILAGIDYGTALDEGCAWPDVPCTDENSVETCYFKTWRNLDKKGTLANRSHYGDLQYWHSMAPAGKHTNGEVLELIVKQLRAWFKKAIDDGQIFHIGKVLHTVQDSYSRSHVIRKPGKGELLQTRLIVRFQAYDAQDAHKHGEADKIQKGGIWKIPGALDARAASVGILNLYKRKAPLDDLEAYLRGTIYPLAPGAKDAEAGGTHEDFRPDWD